MMRPQLPGGVNLGDAAEKTLIAGILGEFGGQARTPFFTSGSN